MNNWRLLLLAVVVVVQPIGSFTESNLIDGRECCERTEEVRFYGTGRRFLDGNREDRRTTDERRLKLFDEPRGWRYARSLSRTERTERRLFLESLRYPREQTFSRATSRKIREDLTRNKDESSSVGQVERDSRKSRSRDALDTTRSVRLSKDARDTRSIRQSRDSLSRLPIRNNRDLEDRQVSGRDTVDNNRERKVVARLGTRDMGLTGKRSDNRFQLEDNRDRRPLDLNNQEVRENQRFSSARDSEIRARMSNGRNEREVRARAELRRQRDIEFRGRIITDNRDTGRVQDTRYDSEMVIQNRMDTRINDGLERQGREENRSFMDTLRNTDERRLSRGSGGTTSARKGQRMERRSESQDRLWETSDARLTRNPERNMREERSSINRDETSDVRQHRENRRATVSTDRATSLQREQLNGSNKMLDSRRVVAQSDNRESVDERREQRDHTRQRFVELTRDRRDTGRTEESRRAIRDNSEERRLQRDRVLSSRNQKSRENESYDLRRQILERGMERAIRMSRSADRRQDVKEIRASRSVEDVRDGTRTTYNRDERLQTRKQKRTIAQRMNRDAVSTQMLVTRLPRTENTRLERAARYHNDVRRTEERDMTERVLVRATRNVETPQRLASRGSRTENIRLERLVGSRPEITDNERREVQRDDTRFDRRSSDRVQAQHRQDNRDSRNEMSRNREIRMNERLDSRRKRDVFSHGSEKVLAERRQDNRESTRRDREEIARNLNDVRVEEIISERQEEFRNRHSRDVRGEVRIVEAERREGNSIARDSRDVRNLAARRILTRTEDNPNARVVRDETRGQREETRRSMIILQRNSRVAERLNERESRPNTQNTRITRKVEQEGERDSDNRRESRKEMRSNAVRIETSRSPLRDERILKHQGDFRNVDVTSDFLEYEEPVGNWKLALFTLQGIYLCGLLVQMLTENGSKSKKRSVNWFSHKDLIKVD